MKKTHVLVCRKAREVISKKNQKKLLRLITIWVRRQSKQIIPFLVSFSLTKSRVFRFTSVRENLCRSTNPSSDSGFDSERRVEDRFDLGSCSLVDIYFFDSNEKCWKSRISGCLSSKYCGTMSRFPRGFVENSSMEKPKIPLRPTICFRPINPSDLERLEQIHRDIFPIRYSKDPLFPESFDYV